MVHMGKNKEIGILLGLRQAAQAVSYKLFK